MSLPSESQSSPISRSTFVTVVAWIFIVLAGFSCVISILQNIMVNLVFPMQEMKFPAMDPQTGEKLPWIFSFLFSHFQLFLLGFLIVSASTFIAAVGLLKRKNWARVLFVLIMCLGIAWNVGGLLMMIPFFSAASSIMATANHPEVSRQFGVMWTVMLVVNSLFVIAFVGLFGWIIKRLVSREVRREFSAG